MVIYSVRLTKKASRHLSKIPKKIVDKFYLWVEKIEHSGVREVRKIKSYHDESLQGKRFGQRSVRLSRSYRAFYVEKHDDTLEFIQILEVNKHDY